jgi:hypothetical protein
MIKTKSSQWTKLILFRKKMKDTKWSLFIVYNTAIRQKENDFHSLSIVTFIWTLFFCFISWLRILSSSHHDVWINHNFESNRIKLSIMLNIIQFDWNDVWTSNQIKCIKKRYETLSWVIKQSKHELDDTLNLDDVTTYSHDSIFESSRNIRHIILDDRHARFSTFDDQHDVYSMLFIQFFYTYSAIRTHLEYESESSTSIIFVVSIRAFVSVNQASRVENQHARSISLSDNFISNQHARSSSSSKIFASTQISYVLTSIISRITKSFFKKLSKLNKIYTNDEKFKSTDNDFDFKLRIFFNKCKRVELSSHAYMKEASFMLTKRTFSYFYDNQYENITFDKFCADMKKFFEESEWKRFNLTKWQFIHIDNVIVVNSNLSLTEYI